MPDNCEKCGGRKHVLTDKGWVPCECLRARHYSRRLETGGVPKYMESMKWRDWTARHKTAARLLPDVKEYFESVVAKEPICRFRCFYGEAGSGKLTLALLFVKECIKRGLTARVATLSEIVADRFGDRGELIDSLLSVDIAVIRLGMEEHHAWNAPTLEKIHFARKMSEKPVIYTTRIDAGSWSGKYGPVLERIFWEPIEGDVVVWDLSNGRVIVP
jgi:DNA replication protein DnaC